MNITFPQHHPVDDSSLEAKIQAFKELMATHAPEFAKTFSETGQSLEVYSGKTTGYRQRAEFSIFHKNQPEYSVHHVTFDKESKQRLFWDQGYPLASNLINSLLIGVNAFMSANYEFAHKLFQVEYLTTLASSIDESEADHSDSDLTGGAIITLIFHRQLTEEEAQAKGSELKEFLIAQGYYQGVDLNIIIRARKSSHVVGKNYLKERFNINGKNLELYQVENSFSQPNAAVNQMMLSYMDKHLHTDKDLLELYCGVGNFTMLLSQKARKVLATEINKQAIKFANLNMELNGIKNLQLGRISAEEFVEAINGVRPFKRLEHIDFAEYDFDTVFVDPPRSGLDNDSLDMISKYRQIGYVSCNPETLWPNLGYLVTKHGYKIERVALFNQFPLTHHLEAIAILSKD